MAQTILTCRHCLTEVGLQFSDETAPKKGCKEETDGFHEWWPNAMRVRLVSDVLLPAEADEDGFADSVSLFLDNLDDPPCQAIETRVEMQRPIEIKMVAKNAYDVSGIPAGDGTYEDAHIERCGGTHWRVDVFASGKADNDEAHRHCEEFKTFQEALDFLLPEA